MDWSQVENDISLFYAMSGHKPVGISKHFQMLFLHEEFCRLVEKDVSSECIWNHLDEYWDLEALDKSEISPFPFVRTTDFELPEDEFGEFISSKRRVNTSNEDTKNVITSKSIDDDASGSDSRDKDSLQRPAATGGKTGKGDWTPAKASPVPTNQSSKLKKKSYSESQPSPQTCQKKEIPYPAADSGSVDRKMRDSSSKREVAPEERKEKRSVSQKDVKSKTSTDESRRESSSSSKKSESKKEEPKAKRSSEVKSSEKRTRTSFVVHSEEKSKRNSDVRKSSSDTLMNLQKRETPQRGGRSSRNVSPSSSTGSRRNASPVATTSRRNSSPSTSAKRTASPASTKISSVSQSTSSTIRKRSMRSDNSSASLHVKRSRR